MYSLSLPGRTRQSIYMRLGQDPIKVVLFSLVSCRVLQPPGGGSSNLFGGYEDDSAASRRPHKMASKVFAPPEEPQSVPKRSNPPGQTGLSGLMNVQRQASLSICQCPGCESCYCNVIIPI